MDKLKEELVLAEMEERDAKLEACDIEGVLAFAEHVVCNAARLWMEFSTDQKQRLQTVLFPQGATFSNKGFGTAVTSPLFNLLQQKEESKSRMATLRGFEPLLPP